MSNFSIIEEEKKLLQPIWHITSTGPENYNIMKRLWCAFNYWIKCPKDKQRVLAQISDSLYDVGLLLDDIEDNAVLRRGVPVANSIYGVPLTVYAIINQTTSLLGQLFNFCEDKEIVIDYFIEMGIQLLRGQGIEIHFRDNCICPTFEEYTHIIHDRWISLLSHGMRLLQLFAKREKMDFTTMLEKISLFIQIYNDYINLHNTKYAAVKTYCDDITEGKFTFPMIHAIQTHPEDHRILNIIEKKSSDNKTKQAFVNILEQFGSFEYTRKILNKLKSDIFKEMSKMQSKENPYLKKVLEDILNNLETEIYFDGN